MHPPCPPPADPVVITMTFPPPPFVASTVTMKANATRENTITYIGEIQNMYVV